MLVLLLVAGCARKYVMTERGPQAYYQTGFPIRDTSMELERILRSIKRVQVAGSYTTYRFALADSITEPAVRDGTAFGRSIEQFGFEHSKAGTATIISRDANRLTLITCEHVTRLPDTLIVFYVDRPERSVSAVRTKYVESVSVRTAQRNMLVGFADGEFSVVARDSVKDIALITLTLTESAERRDAPVLRLTLGDASRLSWGSFVYVLGYPHGFQMVTRGIVSDPNRSPDNSFLLDGLFNRGVSGGLILAVRGDTGELEWVGLASATSGTTEFNLMPERRDIEEAGMLVPYEGRLYIERSTRIDYGMTFSVPSTAIRRFLDRSTVPISATNRDPQISAATAVRLRELAEHQR
jgi:S1-C subfamily serine protease